MDAFGHAQAARALDAIRRELESQGRSAVIAITDAHGELKAFLRLDGAPLSSITVAINKAFTAARLRRPTRELGARLQENGNDIAFYGDPRYVGFGGGMPVLRDGIVIGGVGVSGLSDAEDEALANIGVTHLLSPGEYGA